MAKKPAKKAVDKKKRSTSTGKAKRGRPGSYDPRFCAIARDMVMRGAQRKHVAERLGITHRQLLNWTYEHEEFFLAMKIHNLDVQTDNVQWSLYERATGYEHPDVKVFNANGIPLIVPIVKHYPPDVSAAIKWLEVHKPGYRMKQEVEVSGDESFIAMWKLVSGVATPDDEGTPPVSENTEGPQ